ncbi:hypothetical protein T459_29739 [Capsicum annuum]|uniref:Uncharacterized protein n=1 Tax=Capsicum annuum TaxID=4072 RepID=A0A2G2Y6F2_CAPAN|nr:hypothetical protein T459_29739 [Capsicum annuum]
MGMRSVVPSSGVPRLMEGGSGRSTISGLRYFSDNKGRILSEEERAKETVYIQPKLKLPWELLETNKSMGRNRVKSYEINKGLFSSLERG